MLEPRSSHQFLKCIQHSIRAPHHRFLMASPQSKADKECRQKETVTWSRSHMGAADWPRSPTSQVSALTTGTSFLSRLHPAQGQLKADAHTTAGSLSQHPQHPRIGLSSGSWSLSPPASPSGLPASASLAAPSCSSITFRWMVTHEHT